jgi:hypothetical protein
MSAMAAPVHWHTLSIHAERTQQALRAATQYAHLSSHARELLGQCEKHPCGCTLDLFQVAVQALAEQPICSLREIYLQAFDRYDLSLCPSVIAPLLLVHRCERVRSERLIVGMRPLQDRRAHSAPFGNPTLFAIEAGDVSGTPPRLVTVEGDPDTFFPADTTFLFCTERC